MTKLNDGVIRIELWSFTLMTRFAFIMKSGPPRGQEEYLPVRGVCEEGLHFKACSEGYAARINQAVCVWSSLCPLLLLKT